MPKSTVKLYSDSMLYTLGSKMKEISIALVGSIHCGVFYLLNFYIYFLYFIIPFGKFEPPYLGKATAATRAALPSPTSACWVFSCFRNPPNSDMDYTIFKRAYMTILVHAYTHRGLPVWHTHWQRVSTTFFDPENCHKLCVCSWQGSNLGVFGSWVRHSYQLSQHPCHPNRLITKGLS